jgi:2-methylcitrate dehydratase PrpD
VTVTSVSEAWAAWSSDAITAPLPPDVGHATLRLVEDTIGVLVAGMQEDATRSVQIFANLEARGHAELPESSAALILGTAGHAIDFDSTHFPSMVHASGVIVPAAIACAALGTESATVLNAIAIGHELAVRIGMAGVVTDATGTTTTELFERGFHPTPIPSVIGAAATAGLLLGLDSGQLAGAMGIACSLASGVLEANRAGGTVKAAHSGWAAASGVRAALLARSGLTSPPTAIEGRFGLLRAFMGVDVDPESLVGDVGDRWELLNIGLKAYPTNGFTHPTIDAAKLLRADGLGLDDIATVELGVATPSLRTIAQPAELKRRPPTIYAARFSGPFVFARALLGGSALGIGVGDITEESLGDTEILGLIDKISVIGDQQADRLYPKAISCRATITTHAGQVHEVFIPAALGTTGQPMIDEQVRTKFNDCISTLPDERTREEISSAIRSLGEGSLSTELLAVTKGLAAGAPAAATS